MSAALERAAASPGARQEVARIIAERDITSLYQPIVDLRTGDLVGCEVLSRGPQGSSYHSAPALFRAAATAGLLSELDLLCRTLGLSRVRDAGVNPGIVFVNVEPGVGANLSMNDELLAVLHSLPFQVVVEFTERALAHQPAALLRYRDSVHERGNLIAIDDLGAEPHSLALVPLLKPDILKLDLAVVQGTSDSAGVTAGAAWEYAVRTGAKVVAEGIETEAHRQRAIALGADWGQGYLFGRPGHLDEIDRRPRSTAVSLPWKGAERFAAPTVDTKPRQVSRLMMGVLSQQLESSARRMGTHGVLLATIQTASVMDPTLLDRYTTIAERAAFVGIIGVGVGAEPGPGVHGGDLDPDDPLALQWSVAVVGPHFGAALVATPDPDAEGYFRAVWSQDAVYAADVAEQLTRRITALPDPVEAAPLTPVIIPLTGIWSTIIELMGRPGVRVEAIGEDGLFVPLPEALAPMVRAGIGGQSVLTAVVPEQRELVVSTWMRLRSLPDGGAGAPVRTIGGDDVWMQFVDLRSEHGVYLGLLVPQLADGTPLGTGLSNGSQLVVPSAHGQPRSGWLRKDEQAIVLEADPEACALLGYPASELEGIRTLELIHPDDRDLALTSWIDMLATPGMSRRVRLRHRRADGRYLWCEVINHNELADTQRGYVQSELTDVDAEVLAQQELAAQQRTLRTLAETLTTGVLLVDASGRIAYANQQMVALTEACESTPITDLIPVLHQSDQQAATQAFQRAVRTGEHVRVTVRLPNPDNGDHRLFLLDISPTGDGGAVVCAADVTEETRLHEQLERQATLDALTGCWNRAAILSILTHLVEPAPPGLDRRLGDRGPHLEAPVAVLYIDLDGFKRVNDDYGHAAGDAMLVRTERLLRGALRSTDEIGRLGGDEFLLVCRDVPHAAAALTIAANIRAGLAGDDGVPASVGVAWTGVPVDADALVARADADMYVAKTERRTRSDVKSVSR